jgi:hypothetical protein
MTKSALNLSVTATSSRSDKPGKKRTYKKNEAAGQEGRIDPLARLHTFSNSEICHDIKIKLNKIGDCPDGVRFQTCQNRRICIKIKLPMFKLAFTQWFSQGDSHDR